MTGTGLLRWAGMPPEHTWHGATGYLLLGAVAVHLWLVRRHGGPGCTRRASMP